LIEKFPNEVDNILTKDMSSFHEVKNKFLQLHLANSNGDSAHHMFSNKKIKNLKNGSKSSGLGSSKLPPSISKDFISTKARTYTRYPNHHPSTANSYGEYECSKLKELNKSGSKEKGKGREQHIARYNPDTDSEAESSIHQDTEVSPTTKSIFDFRASTHIILDTVLFQDIWYI
jgi:hypothetical protein